MTLTHLDYVPVRKWRQGEYQALMRLHPTKKDRVTPLIEITPPDFDFETQEPAKSLDDHLLKFGPRLKTKWGARPAFLDTSRLDPTARMIGGVHPLTHLLDVARGVEGRLPRHEWSLYKALIDRPPKYMRIPTFGDYAIAAPELPQGDMRLMKPSATVRCTIDDAWLISKGSDVRDNGFGQYEGQCNHVASLPSFLGVGFSAGGDYIHQCGLGLASTGTLTT